jgi:SulP family sulfate permease
MLSISPMFAVAHAFPLTGTLRTYRRQDLPADLIAGGTVAVLLVPQAMGYAMLAGLPPEVGLYACTLPLIVYALLGTLRQLAVGPVAMVSLLIDAQVAPLAGGDAALYLSLAAQMAPLVGVLRAGWPEHHARQVSLPRALEEIRT